MVLSTVQVENNLGTEQVVTKEKITGESSLAHHDELHIRTSLTNVVYVAVQGFSAQEIKLQAVSGQLYRTYTKSNVTFENGKYYDITVKMEKVNTLTSRH